MRWVAVLALVALGVGYFARRRLVALGLRARTAFRDWRRARLLGDEPFRTRHPIVLVHGLLGFDEVRFPGRRHQYFRGVEARLRRHGNEVYRPRLPPVASIRRRAEALVAFLESLGPRPVILVAHSLGGLDARYAIARLGAAERIKALITVGTPHRGTPLADAGTKFAGRLGVRALARALRLDVEVFDELTSTRMASFNREVPDAPGVLYGSVIGRPRGEVHPLLRTLHRHLRGRHGDNDGLVDAASQRWGVVFAEVEADHWAQVGWSTFDAGGLYESIARELRARGL